MVNGYVNEEGVMHHRRLIAVGAAVLFPLTGTIVAVVAAAMTAAVSSVVHHAWPQPHRLS
jgi:hypothetical protein